MSISYILMLDRENYIETVDVRYFEGIEFQLFSILSSWIRNQCYIPARQNNCHPISKMSGQ